MNEIKKEALVFISHHRETCENLVNLLSNFFTSYGIEHWYAERDIPAMKNYTEEIPIAIEKSTLFLLLLNTFSNNSSQVLREVQCALNYKKKILIVKLDDCIENPSIQYITSICQYIDLKNYSRDSICSKICKTIQNIFSNNQINDFEEVIFSNRMKNELNFFEDKGENRRLSFQRKLLFDFAKDVYKQILDEYSDFSFLDIGCNTGEMSMLFLNDENKNYKYIGIDKEESGLKYGQSLFPQNNYFQLNCEEKDFNSKLIEIEKKLNIKGFDIINISMVLLHLKNPNLVLDILKSHLNENGTFIVLDIDDGLNVAYPDPVNEFKRAIELCSETIYSGYRMSGRQINYMLSNIEMEKIVLHKAGISTVGMSRNQREEFFEIYFWIILDDLKKMNALFPNNDQLKIELEWYEAAYDNMKLQFKKKNFFFNLGFVLFSAK